MENNKLPVDRDLLVDMVKYILTRPASEVFKLVERMRSTGLLVDSPAQPPAQLETPSQDTPPTA